MKQPLRCLTCPLCDGPPALAWPVLTPWFCVNDDCEALAWDPYSSLAENLMDAHAADITITPPPAAGTDQT